MRITQLQFDRLDAARQRDGLAMQEHVRRALDYYLEKLDRDQAKAPVVTTGSAPAVPRTINEPFSHTTSPEAPSAPFSGISVAPPPQIGRR